MTGEKAGGGPRKAPAGRRWPENRKKGGRPGPGAPKRPWTPKRVQGERRRPERAPPAEPAGLGARRLAVRLIEAVLKSRRALDDALEGLGSEAWVAALEPRDRAFGRLIAATVLRRAGSLEAVLARFLERPLPETAWRARAVLLSAAAQILLVGTPAHAAINLAVEQCQRDAAARRYDKLANAVLRRVATDGPGILRDLRAAEIDVPGWMLARWAGAYGEARAREIAEASLAEAPLDLSVKVSTESRGLAERLGGELLATGSIRLQEHGRVEELAGFEDGAWWVQDAAAALPARLLGDVRRRDIADLCAAPGGKTAELAAAGARVLAVDQSSVRLERLRGNVARLGMGAEIETVEADAGTWTPGRLLDGVLLDAPCTATGTIRRHPDILHLKRESDAHRLAGLQGRLLAHAASLVKPGGTLVYCVCSLEPEEGPGVVEAFLASDAGKAFMRAPIRPEEIAGEPDWITADGDLRTLPCQAPRVMSQDASGPATGGMDGFYAARLRRREQA